MRRICTLGAAIWFLAVSPSDATEWFVEPGGTGNGTSNSPFGRVQDGLNSALPGDTVTIRPGTYTESVRTVRNGAEDAAIRVRAVEPRTVVITASGVVLRVDHAYIVFEGLVLDGQYGADDAVDVNNGAHFLQLENLEVRRSGQDPPGAPRRAVLPP